MTKYITKYVSLSISLLFFTVAYSQNVIEHNAAVPQQIGNLKEADASQISTDVPPEHRMLPLTIAKQADASQISTDVPPEYRMLPLTIAKQADASQISTDVPPEHRMLPLTIAKEADASQIVIEVPPSQKQKNMELIQLPVQKPEDKKAEPK